MSFQLGSDNPPSFRFDPSGVRLNLDPDKLRKGILKSFPLRLRALLFSGAELGESLESFGFWSLSLGGAHIPKIVFALAFDLDLGLPGSFAEAGASLTAHLALGWRHAQHPDGPGFALGLGLPSLGSSGRREFGLQGVLKLVAEDFRIDHYNGSIALVLKACHLEVLGVSIPSGHGFDTVVVVKAGQTQVAWFGALLEPIDIQPIFKLDYLALGQRIRPLNQGNCAAVIDDFKKLAQKTPAEIVARVDPNVGWTIATRMKSDALAGTLDVVFSDPSLGCLRLDMLGIIKLDVAYRRITDDIGLFAIDTPFPIHRMEFGAVSLTFPNIGLDVYTNGDFRVDIGFPRGVDFSRSCDVQALPFVGAGGFYVGKLSGKTSSLIRDAAVAPVLQAGIALRLGLGKTIELGPFRAGISVTVFGVLEGALGYRDKPFEIMKPTDIALLARVGIVAEIYGSVDFGIIKASVQIRLAAEAGVFLAVSRGVMTDLVLYVAASVTVGVEVVLASFKIFGHRIEIKITFHFTAELRFEWPIKGRAQGLLHAAAAPPLPISFVSKPMLPAGTPLPAIDLWFIADATMRVAADHPRAECVLFSAIPRTRMDDSDAPPSAGDTSVFDTMAETFLRWVLELGGVAPSGATIVSREGLREIDGRLRQPATLADQPSPLDVTTINQFLKDNFRITFRARPAGIERRPGAFFPFIPDLRYCVSYGGADVTTDLAAAPRVYDDRYRRDLTQRFAKLFEEHRASPPPHALAVNAQGVAPIVLMRHGGHPAASPPA